MAPNAIGAILFLLKPFKLLGSQNSIHGGRELPLNKLLSASKQIHSSKVNCKASFMEKKIIILEAINIKLDNIAAF